MDDAFAKELSVSLLYWGFLPVLGAMENKGGKQSLITRGHPFTYDRNMGVLAVYDEDGRPWIRKYETLRISFGNRLGNAFEDKLLPKFSRLKQGAYVPHSNDGGFFFEETWPKLFETPSVSRKD